MKTMIDLFAGVGGLSQGFIENGFELIFANDNDRWAGETFKENHPGVLFSDEDITTLDEAKLYKELSEPKLDLLVGGVPCQAFSMAGYRNRKNRAGLVDERVYLFRHFLRVANQFKPKVIVIENVKGLPSMLGGSVLEEIIFSLRESGYTVDWKILNAASYGAPQLRERFVLLANRIGVANSFPTPYFDETSFKTVGPALENVPNLNHEPRELSGITLERVKLIQPGKNWQSLPDRLKTKSQHSGAYGRLDPNQPSRTLLTRFDSPPVGYVTHPYFDRALTVREGARIQGFEDNFRFMGPRMQQYKQVGNAVSPYLSRALAREINLLLEI